MADKFFVKCKVFKVDVKDAIRVTLEADPPNRSSYIIEVNDPHTFDVGVEVMAVVQDGKLIDLWKRPK